VFPSITDNAAEILHWVELVSVNEMKSREQIYTKFLGKQSLGFGQIKYQ